MSNEILFILFPGFGCSYKIWSNYFENNKRIKTNFITRLKKIGKIYFYKPSYYNVLLHIEPSVKNIFYFNKKLDFTNENLDVENECDKIYNDIKKLYSNNYKYIIISHSIGSYFNYCFSQKYSSKILLSIYLDGPPLGPELYKTYPSDYNLDEKINNIKKFSKYKDSDIELLKNNILVNNDIGSTTELKKCIYFKIKKYEQQTQKAKILKTKTLFIHNFELDNLQRDENLKNSWTYFWQNARLKETEYFTKYNNNFNAITVINKTHFLFHKQDIINLIISNIKLNIL